MRFLSSRFVQPFRCQLSFSPAAWIHNGAILLVLAATSLLTVEKSSAQGGNIGGFGTLGGVEPTGQYPSQQYYIGLQLYRSGDLEEAIEVFDDALRGSRRDINGRWIDAIPALAMLAECHWHLGNLPAARENLDQAFQIAIRYRGWLGRVDWQSSVQVGAQRSTPAWLWPEAAAVGLVPVSETIMLTSGRPLTEQALRLGGEIEELNVRTMDVVEIMRGLAVASYRRRVILGPLAEEDRLASSLLDATKYPAGLQIPVARALIGSMRSTGYFTNHDDQQAVRNASRSAMFNGGVHPITAITLLSQASAIAGGNDPQSAVPICMNLVNISAALGQPEWIGEAMQLAAGTANQQQAAMVRQAANKIASTMFRRSRLATLHCLVAGADASITAGDLDSAASLLSQAQTLSARRDVLQPRIDAYGAYVAARFAAARGSSFGIQQSTDLDDAIQNMSAFALHHRIRRQALVSMPRIYQLALIRQAIGTTLGGNTSDALLRQYCDDPPAEVWRRDPVDALSGMLADRSVAHATRVNLAASAGYGEKLLQAVDAMLASRFTQRLPLGGRVAQVRALARAEDGILDPSLVEFRTNAGPAISEIRNAAIAMADPNVAEVEILEAKACAVALSRLPLPNATPPRLDEKLPVARLGQGTGLLSFAAVGNNLFATLSVNGKVTMWNVAGSSRLPGEIGRLLRGIGVGKTRGNRLPEDDSWKTAAVALRRHLFPDDLTITEERLKQLIVVPDGPLWYLPFEMLPLGDERSPLIGDKIDVKYAATPGLALKPVAMLPASQSMGISSGLFFAPRDPEHNASITQSLVDVVNDPIRLPDDVDLPSGMLGHKVGHLVVASPREPNMKSPFAMSVTPYDQASPYSTLAAWMRFPADVPRSVVLFGFRTSVDVGQMGSGEEVFTTLCGLQVAGVRSVLLSRWAVGGESSAIALRELLQELPFTGMNRAWKRARMLLRRSELDPAREPLLIKAEHSREGLTGEQPLFWAGYLVSSPEHPVNPATND